MNETDNVLNNIDEALMWERNWEHSAMRWNPDAERDDWDERPLPRWSDARDFSVTGRLTPPIPFLPLPQSMPPHVHAAIQTWRVTQRNVIVQQRRSAFVATWGSVREAMRPMVRAMVDMERAFHPLTHVFLETSAVRCRRCSPRANPPPLCINGAEYHRRRRNR